MYCFETAVFLKTKLSMKINTFDMNDFIFAIFGTISIIFKEAQCESDHLFQFVLEIAAPTTIICQNRTAAVYGLKPI